MAQDSSTIKLDHAAKAIDLVTKSYRDAIKLHADEETAKKINETVKVNLLIDVLAVILGVNK